MNGKGRGQVLSAKKVPVADVSHALNTIAGFLNADPPVASAVPCNMTTSAASFNSTGNNGSYGDEYVHVGSSSSSSSSSIAVAPAVATTASDSDAFVETTIEGLSGIVDILRSRALANETDGATALLNGVALSKDATKARGQFGRNASRKERRAQQVPYIRSSSSSSNTLDGAGGSSSSSTTAHGISISIPPTAQLNHSKSVGE